MLDEAYKILEKTTEQNWWYRVRRKIVKDIIKKYAKENKEEGIKILDIGCGVGDLLGELNNPGKCYGVDRSEKAVELCRKRGLNNVVTGNAITLPFEKDSFDIVLTLDMLEHLEDDDKAIKEAYRVLKPGGTAVLFVPAFNFLWGKSDELGKHFRRYKLENLVAKTRGENFKVVKASYFNFFLFLPILFIRLLVRFLKLKSNSENEIGPALNSIFYYIFLGESFLLKYLNLPFGVSAMVVARK